MDSLIIDQILIFSKAFASEHKERISISVSFFPPTRISLVLLSWDNTSSGIETLITLLKKSLIKNCLPQYFIYRNLFYISLRTFLYKISMNESGQFCRIR